MSKFILGKKLEMTQVFDKEGNVYPVTLIEAGPCYVTQIKTGGKTHTKKSLVSGKDGYEAIQVGFIRLKEKKVKKPQKQKPYRYLKEFKGDIKEYKIGDKISVDIFKAGEVVKISGTSKGKGFQGVVKRWGFGGKPATHGAKHELRTTGSIGSRFPQHTAKGRKMPGRMGGERVTVRNLKIIEIDKENNLIAVKGAVPGPRGSLTEIVEK